MGLARGLTRIQLSRSLVVGYRLLNSRSQRRSHPLVRTGEEVETESPGTARQNRMVKIVSAFPLEEHSLQASNISWIQKMSTHIVSGSVKRHDILSSIDQNREEITYVFEPSDPNVGNHEDPPANDGANREGVSTSAPPP